MFGRQRRQESSFQRNEMDSNKKSGGMERTFRNFEKRKFIPLSGDGFQTGFSNTRAERKRELHKMILAHSDVHAAFKAAEHFLSIMVPYARTNQTEYAGMDHPVYSPLVEAIVISYARPFTANNSLGQLKREWHRFPQARLQCAHEKLLKARNELIAHSDMVVRQVKIHPPGPSIVKGLKAVGVGYSIRNYSFSIRQVIDIRDAAVDLAKRLHTAVEKLLNDLYEGMDLPGKPFYLRFDDGL